jgi:Amt family ammonium transporter
VGADAARLRTGNAVTPAPTSPVVVHILPIAVQPRAHRHQRGASTADRFRHPYDLTELTTQECSLLWCLPFVLIAFGSPTMENFKTSADVLFILLGAIMILAMHAGFAFLELGTVRKKNQINALVKILCDFSVSTLAYFFIGYGIAYGVHFFAGAETLVQKSGYELTKFFFLLTFAAAIPAIVSGGIAERARFGPQLAATFLLVGFIYPFFEGIAWNQAYGIQAALKSSFGEEFHDFAGSVVVHAVGGWVGLAAVILLGARRGRYQKDGGVSAHPPSSIPFLALGAWILIVGWFGFNVMSAQTLDKVSGLVAMNSLMAMVGGTLVALVAGKNDPGFVHNGPLAGLVAICAGSDLMHPLGALITGGVAGGLFVMMFTLTQNRWKIDDVLGVWPLHGLCGAWGGIAAGIFGAKALGGLGGVAFMSQLAGTALGIVIAFGGGLIVYGALKAFVGIRLDAEDEFNGTDLTIHKISASAERETLW